VLGVRFCDKKSGAEQGRFSGHSRNAGTNGKYLNFVPHTINSHLILFQVNMLAVIEKERVKMKKQTRKEKEQRLLEESCSPIKWKTHNGITISMETIKIQHANFLKQLHEKLFATDMSTSELKENLILTKQSLNGSKNDTKISELAKLIDRELQLIEFGFPMKDFKTLHLRLEKLFTNLICDPSTQKQPKGKFFLCKQCRKMLPPKSFTVPLNRPDLKLCTSCNWIDNMSHKRVDHSPFAQMLRELQQFEARKGCYKSMAFVLEVHDVKYLVDQIWHGQSAVSQSLDLTELRLGRWDCAKEWSPWNTVLLTKKELQQHLGVPDLNLVYGEAFIRSIHIKHLIAQIYFKGCNKAK
jgi:RNase P subunit RPR2